MLFFVQNKFGVLYSARTHRPTNIWPKLTLRFTKIQVIDLRAKLFERLMCLYHYNYTQNHS